MTQRKKKQPVTRDLILGSQDSTIEKVEVPEWNTDVYVRSFSAEYREHYEHVMDKLNKTERVRATLVALAACDKDGNELFTMQDVPQLMRKDAVAMERVFKVACRLNGLEGKAVEAAASE